MIEDLAKIRDMVKVLLTRHEIFRKNDEYLILEINAIYGYAKKVTHIKYGKGYFIPEHLVRSRKLIKFESIRRVRQKLQEEFPELRPDERSYKARHKEAENMRLFIK